MSWEATWSDGVNVAQITGGGCAFNFPANGHVNYLTKGAKPPSKFLSASITITGQSPKFQSLDNTGPMPPQIRFFLQKKGDDMASDGYRWWSNPANVVLALGTFNVRVPLTPDQWQGVFGKMANSSKDQTGKFKSAIANLDRIGVTFGGGNSFGHGVMLKSGSAKVTISSFKFTQ